VKSFIFHCGRFNRGANLKSNMYSLSYKNIKPILLYILIGLFAYSFAGALSNIMAEKTLGSIFRHFLPSTPYLLLMLLISLQDIRKFSFSTFVPSLPSNFNFNLILKWVFWIFILAVPLGVFLSLHGPRLGLLYGPVIIFIIFSFFYSIYQMISGREAFSLMAFVVAFPFLAFIEWDFRYVYFVGVFNRAEIGPFLFSPTNLFIILMVFVFTAKHFLFSGKIHLSTPFIKWFFLWLVVLTFSVLLKNNVAQMEAFRWIFFGYIIPFLFLILVINTLKTKEDINIFIWILLLCSVLSAFLGFYFQTKEVGLDLNDLISAYGKLYAVTISPHNRAVSIALSIPVSIALFLSINREQKKEHVAGLLIMLFLIIMLLTSFSRSSIVGCFVSFLVFMKSRKWQLSTLLGVVFLIIFWDWFEKTIFVRFEEIFQGILAGQFWDVFSGKIGSTQRHGGWIAAVEMFKDHPFTGIGHGMWDTLFPEYGTPFIYKLKSGQIFTSYIGGAHNQYLHFLAELGLIGLSVFVIFIASIFMEIYKVKKLARDPFYSNVLTGVIGVLVCGLSLSIWGGFFGTHSSYLGQLVLWGSLGLVVVIKRLSLEQTLSEERYLS